MKLRGLGLFFCLMANLDLMATQKLPCARMLAELSGLPFVPQSLALYKQLAEGATSNGYGSGSLFPSNLQAPPTRIPFRSAKFAHEKPKSSFSMRAQMMTESELEFILNQGIPSRARIQEVAGLEAIEEQLIESRTVFTEIAELHKAAWGDNRVSALPFASPFVESTNKAEMAFSFAKNSSILERENTNSGLALIKIKSQRGVEEGFLRNKKQSIGEGGVLFVGGISSTEIDQVLYFSKSGEDEMFGWTHWTRNSEGTWTSESVESDYYYDFIIQSFPDQKLDELDF